MFSLIPFKINYIVVLNVTLFTNASKLNQIITVQGRLCKNRLLGIQVILKVVNKSSTMNTRQKLELIMDELNDEQLSILLDSVVLLKSKEKTVVPMIQSQAYKEWLSSENDIYDELFTDELSTR